MKNLIIIALMTLLTLPAFATCSITGGAACAPTVLDSPTLKDKHAPDPLKQIQEPNAFQPKYVTPYYDMLINTETTKNESINNETQSYNSNCQFGVCLPGASVEE